MREVMLNETTNKRLSHSSQHFIVCSSNAHPSFYVAVLDS